TEKQVTKTLQSAGGIGTVATRADIIDKLINGQYIEWKGKYLYLTQTGKQLLELAPEDLRSPALTAEWEKKLIQIEKGQLKKEQFISEIKTYTKDIVRQVKNMEATFKHDNITGTKCPRCGGLMLEIENKHGKMLRCKDQSCQYKKNIYKNTNARCPNCICVFIYVFLVLTGLIFEYKKNIYKNTNARCPNCKKKLKLYGEGDGQT